MGEILLLSTVILLVLVVWYVNNKKNKQFKIDEINHNLKRNNYDKTYSNQKYYEELNSNVHYFTPNNNNINKQNNNISESVNSNNNNINKNNILVDSIQNTPGSSNIFSKNKYFINYFFTPNKKDASNKNNYNQNDNFTSAMSKINNLVEISNMSNKQLCDNDYKPNKRRRKYSDDSIENEKSNSKTIFIGKDQNIFVYYKNKIINSRFFDKEYYKYLLLFLFGKILYYLTGYSLNNIFYQDFSKKENESNMNEKVCDYNLIQQNEQKDPQFENKSKYFENDYNYKNHEIPNESINNKIEYRSYPSKNLDEFISNDNKNKLDLRKYLFLDNRMNEKNLRNAENSFNKVIEYYPTKNRYSNEIQIIKDENSSNYINNRHNPNHEKYPHYSKLQNGFSEINNYNYNNYTINGFREINFVSNRLTNYRENYEKIFLNKDSNKNIYSNFTKDEENDRFQKLSINKDIDFKSRYISVNQKNNFKINYMYENESENKENNNENNYLLKNTSAIANISNPENISNISQKEKSNKSNINKIEFSNSTQNVIKFKENNLNSNYKNYTSFDKNNGISNNNNLSESKIKYVDENKNFDSNKIKNLSGSERKNIKMINNKNKFNLNNSNNNKNCENNRIEYNDEPCIIKNNNLSQKLQIEKIEIVPNNNNNKKDLEINNSSDSNYLKEKIVNKKAEKIKSTLFGNKILTDNNKNKIEFIKMDILNLVNNNGEEILKTEKNYESSIKKNKTSENEKEFTVILPSTIKKAEILDHNIDFFTTTIKNKIIDERNQFNDNFNFKENINNSLKNSKGKNKEDNFHQNRFSLVNSVEKYNELNNNYKNSSKSKKEALNYKKISSNKKMTFAPNEFKDFSDIEINKPNNINQIAFIAEETESNFSKITNIAEKTNLNNRNTNDNPNKYLLNNIIENTNLFKELENINKQIHLNSKNILKNEFNNDERNGKINNFTSNYKRLDNLNETNVKIKNVGIESYEDNLAEEKKTNFKNSPIIKQNHITNENQNRVKMYTNKKLNKNNEKEKLKYNEEKINPLKDKFD